MKNNVFVYETLRGLIIVVCKLMLLFFIADNSPKGKITSNVLYTLLCVVFLFPLLLLNPINSLNLVKTFLFMGIGFNEGYVNEFLQRFKNNDNIILFKHNENDRKAWSTLVKRGLIEYLGDDEFSLTFKGKQVLKAGSWDKYLTQEQSKEERRERKENLDLLMSEFQVKSKLLPYIFSTIGLIISIASIIISTKSCKEQQVHKQVPKSELVKIIDSVLISNQKMKGEPLHNLNIEE